MKNKKHLPMYGMGPVYDPVLHCVLAVLLLIVVFWNRASDFKTAYLQSLLFLEVMNWYDGVSCFDFLSWRWKG